MDVQADLNTGHTGLIVGFAVPYATDGSEGEVGAGIIYNANELNCVITYLHVRPTKTKTHLRIRSLI